MEVFPITLIVTKTHLRIQMLSVLLICKFKELTNLGPVTHSPPPQDCPSPESVLPSKTSITHRPTQPESGEDPDERLALRVSTVAVTDDLRQGIPPYPRSRRWGLCTSSSQQSGG